MRDQTWSLRVYINLDRKWTTKAEAAANAHFTEAAEEKELLTA